MNKTNFYVYRNDTLLEIQSCFSRFFPNRAINFFSNKDENQSNDSCVMFSPEVRLQDISPDSGDVCIELNHKMTTDDLEKLINDHFGLHVEISPATGNQTHTVSRQMSWSPKKNNHEGVRLPERSDA